MASCVETPKTGSGEDLYVRSSGESWSFQETKEIKTGEDLYSETCSDCHGVKGEGLLPRQAPKIAGLQQWYLERQMRNFKASIRGDLASDPYGSQMVYFSWALGDDEEIKRLSKFIAELPDTPAPQTISGDLGLGEEIYNDCVVCHGRRGEGNKDFNAPRLAGIDDWYLVSQLRNFQVGIRGYHEKDIFGRRHSTITKRLLTDDASITDVVTYINVLATKDSQSGSIDSRP